MDENSQPIVVIKLQAMVTIDSEMSGLISGPSGANGVAGVKPTIGLVSRAGFVSLSESQDTAKQERD
jgi:amidase